MYFRNYGRRNTWLIKSVKRPLSESTSEATYKGDQTLLKSEPHDLYRIYSSL